VLSEVKLRLDLTIAQFGCDPKDLLPGSKQFVIVECTNCATIIRREYRNSYRRHQCPIVVGNKKRCHKCKEWKDLSLFNKNGRLSGGVAKLCRQCYNSHDAVRKLESQRARRLQSAISEGDYKYYIKRRINCLCSRANLNRIPCNIDIEYMTQLWEQQQGLCYYTNIPMSGSGTDRGLPAWNSPSVDRIDPGVGYIIGNVVWCLNCINSFKADVSIDQFKTLIEQSKWWFQRETTLVKNGREID
jgi:hypothetical protein